LNALGYWSKYQHVLNDDQQMVWHWLGELRSLATSVPRTVSELRMLDILLWMSIDGRTKTVVT
jgi:hypothetical protein